jgi:hypothetical protein
MVQIGLFLDAVELDEPANPNPKPEARIHLIF